MKATPHQTASGLPKPQTYEDCLRYVFGHLDCLYAGKDPEGHEITFNEKKVTVPTAAFGYEHAINRMVANLERFDLAPKDAILVFEGMQSKKPRLQIDPQYKANRGQRPDEVYGVFQDLRRSWKQPGEAWALCISQRQVEADDILGYLAENAEEPLVISTYDNDLSVLNGVNSYQAPVQVLVGSNLPRTSMVLFPSSSSRCTRLWWGHLTISKAALGSGRQRG